MSLNPPTYVVVDRTGRFEVWASCGLKRKHNCATYHSLVCTCESSMDAEQVAQALHAWVRRGSPQEEE